MKPSKPLYYYLPGSMDVREIPGSWPEDRRKMQIDLLLAGGAKPVLEYERPKSQMPFARLVPNFTDCGSYVEVDWEEIPNRLHLSHEKLLARPEVSGRLTDLYAAAAENEEMRDWWTSDDPVYVRGSALATALQVFLGLTRDQLEDLVLSCRR